MKRLQIYTFGKRDANRKGLGNEHIQVNSRYLKRHFRNNGEIANGQSFG